MKWTLLLQHSGDSIIVKLAVHVYSVYFCGFQMQTTVKRNCAGGFFIVLSYLWGWAVDGMRPDAGDWIGCSVALVGVCIAMFWRRWWHYVISAPVSDHSAGNKYAGAVLLHRHQSGLGCRDSCKWASRMERGNYGDKDAKCLGASYPVSQIQLW